MLVGPTSAERPTQIVIRDPYVGGHLETVIRAELGVSTFKATVSRHR